MEAVGRFLGAREPTPAEEAEAEELA
jgi:hypothetical protein